MVRGLLLSPLQSIRFGEEGRQFPNPRLLVIISLPRKVGGEGGERKNKKSGFYLEEEQRGKVLGQMRIFFLLQKPK